LNHGQTGINHCRQLAGENNQVRQGDFSTAGASLFADLFLDGNNQQVTIQQRSDGGLLGGCIDGTADLPSATGFSRYVNE
jgi:hypothetical protein